MERDDTGSISGASDDARVEDAADSPVEWAWGAEMLSALPEAAITNGANGMTRRQGDHLVYLPGEMKALGPGHHTLVHGSKLGSAYVRVQPPMAPAFRRRGEDVVEATEVTLAPRTLTGRGYERMRRMLIGRRLATAQQVHERLTKVKALAVLSSDAISSVAYGTEASLGILILAGAGAMRFNLAIAACIIALMLIVGTSYYQTIHAYPHGGGSYIVARDNLGDWAGLVAAAALLIDYVLTVSVSVSAGVDALVSAVPELGEHPLGMGGLAIPAQVALGSLCILIIMVVNLRGIRESGTIFAAPTYLFIVSFLIMIGAGVIHAATSGGGLLGAVAASVPPARLGWGTERLGVLLVLTAFASGCAAMTGTEAISNGVPAFKPPESHNAARTLLWMVGILATFYAGTTYLAWRFGIEPNPSQNPTVDAQIGNLLFVGPFRWMFYLVQIATLLILVLAANTSFADFPRLSSILARDHFLPHQFSFRGDRLAFSTGIVVLALLSGVLLVRFEGNTDALINLYALGVFTAFTLSQSGMVVRWWRKRSAAGARWRRALAINAAGAVATGAVTLVIGVTKFDRGAWIVVVLAPLLVLLFRGIHRHYAEVERQVTGLEVRHADEIQTIMLVPVAGLDRVALRSLVYAQSLTPHVIALHVASDPDEEQAMRRQWMCWLEAKYDGKSGSRSTSEPPRLVIIESPYRSLVAPLVNYVDATRDANPGAMVTVVLPEFVPAHWWERLLHNQTALRLKLALYSHRGVAVANIPYHLAGAQTW